MSHNPRAFQWVCLGSNRLHHMMGCRMNYTHPMLIDPRIAFGDVPNACIGHRLALFRAN